MNVDPIEMFDRLEPPEGWSEPTDIDNDPVAAQILERVFAEGGNVISLDAARRRRRAIGGAVVVAALVAGGAVAAIWNRRPDTSNVVSCYSDAALEPAVAVQIGWDGETDPAELCAPEWSTGALGVLSPADELRVCVTGDGVAAVIPGGDELCDELGLTEYAPPSPRDLAQAVTDADRELREIFLPSNRCVPPSEAEPETKRVLDKFGLSGWTITIAGTFSADEPCASVALDIETTTAFVRPVRRG